MGSNPWGRIGYNRIRGAWYVRGRWQGEIHTFSAIRTARGGWLSCKTRDMAEFLSQEIGREIARGSFHPSRFKKTRPHTFRDFAKRWIADQQHLTHVTRRGYHSYLSHHLIPAIGEKLICDVSHQDYIDLYNAFGAAGMAPKTVKNILTLLFEIMTAARRAGLIAQEPERLEFRGARGIPPQTIEYLDRTHQERILAEIPAEHRPIFEYLMLTGCRPSEARALRWKDIRDDHILVAVAWTPSKNGGEELKPPKSRRIDPIPLTDAVRELLSRIPRNLREFVFIHPKTGEPYSKNINRNIWNPACKKALGYEFPLNKACRHSFASQLIAAGVALEDVSTLLRHSDSKVTRAHYGKPDLAVLKKAVDNVRGMK